MTLVFFSFFYNIPIGEAQTRRVFMWWQTTIEPTFSASAVGPWAKNLGVTDFGIYYILSADDRAYMQTTLGLHLFQIYIIPTTTNLMNWTEWISGWVAEAVSLNSDGIIFDDTQMVWYQAHENGTVDDLYWYQQFMNNVTAYAVPEFGSDNVIVEMAAYGDSPDYDDDMPLINATDFIFSYYYEPDPEIKYLGGLYTNSSLSAWDIKGYYDVSGLNTYYKYQGWLWLEGSWSGNMLTTYSLMQTYNAIVTLADSYTVDDLMIYNVYQLYYNHKDRMAPFLKEIITAWKADNTLSTSKILLQNYPELYWSEYFTMPPGLINQSAVNTEGWQIVESGTENYTYSTAGNYLTIKHNGTSVSGWKYLTLERLIGSAEFGIGFSAKIKPINSSSSKVFILRGQWPYPNAYIFQFHSGEERNLTFGFRDAWDNDNATAIGHWTLSSQYYIGLTTNETYVQASISNSTWSWNYNVTESFLKWTAIKLYSVYYQDILGGGYGSADVSFTSATIDDIRLIPLRNSYSFEEYELGKDIIGEFTSASTVYLYFGGYTPPINATGITNYEVFASVDPTLNDSLKFDLATNTEFTLHWIFTPNYLEYTTLCIGLIGIGMLIFSPSWLAWKIKQGGDIIEIGERAMYVMLIFIVGLGLVFVWLWA